MFQITEIAGAGATGWAMVETDNEDTITERFFDVLGLRAEEVIALGNQTFEVIFEGH